MADYGAIVKEKTEGEKGEKGGKGGAGRDGSLQKTCPRERGHGTRLGRCASM